MDMGSDDVASMFTRMMGIKQKQQTQRSRDWANSPVNFQNQLKFMNDAEARIQTPPQPANPNSLKGIAEWIVRDRSKESGIPTSTNDNIPLEKSESTTGNMLGSALSSAGSGFLKGGSFGLGSGLAHAGISGVTSLISNAFSGGKQQAAEQLARDKAAQQTIQNLRDQRSNRQFF